MAHIAVYISITLLIVVFFFWKCFNCKSKERTYQDLIDNINVGYYKYRTRDGVILSANQGFINIFELDMGTKEVVGRSISELMIYVDGKESIRKQLKERGKLVDHEYHFKTLKGKDKYVLHNSRLSYDFLSREEIVVGLIEDITEQQAAHNKMKESQEKYEQLFKSSGDMVFIFDLESFVIKEINPITEVITGFSAEEVEARPVENIFHPTSRKKLKNSREDLLFGGASKMEAVIVCKDGSYREVLITMSLVNIKGENCAIAVIKDISALVKDKEENFKRQKELEEFCNAAIEREERINNLREELEKAKQKIKNLEKNNERKSSEKRKA